MRRLAAILAADVVGFSAIMSRDEDQTLAALIRLRQSIFDPSGTKHSGRRLKLTGNGALVEFASVADAVRCALEVQTSIAADQALDIQLRIGVNLGDIILKGSDIHGDGLNVAARLESIAAPGGISISGIVQQSIGNRVDAPFSDQGLQELKNIDRPFQVYAWAPDGHRENLPLSKAPGKAALAVLAFYNMSTDPEQEYFSDGIAEDIITALSHFRDFFVIARNTTFS